MRYLVYWPKYEQPAEASLIKAESRGEALALFVDRNGWLYRESFGCTDDTYDLLIKPEEDDDAAWVQRTVVDRGDYAS